MSVPNFSQLENFSFLNQIYPKKHFRMEYLDECVQSENDLFSVKNAIIWLVQVVSGVFGWFQVVHCLSKYDFFQCPMTKLWHY